MMMKTQLNDLFDQMENEEGNVLDNKIQVEMDEVTEELIDNLNRSSEEVLMNENFGVCKIHLNKILPKKYSSEEITKFSLALTDKIVKENRTEVTGIYLNHLIQESPDQNHIINIRHLEQRLNYIGWHNEKNITIEGNIGSYCFEKCESGISTINGSISGVVGEYMINGIIKINGTIAMTSDLISGGEIYFNDERIR